MLSTLLATATCCFTAEYRRGGLVRRFKTDPDYRVFLSTDAGGVGLNPQCPSVVMNLDLPWNPAVLEQRIGHTHRLGQHRPVQVLNFVAERSIEHYLMGLLAFKQSLAAGVLGGGDKEVHPEGSPLTRFMENVERATAPPSPPSPPVELADVATSATARRGAVPPGTRGAANPKPRADENGRDGNPWRSLLVFGQALLAEMARNHGSDTNEQSGRLVRRDPETGERNLHVPVPEKETMARLADVLSDLLAGRRSAAENIAWKSSESRSVGPGG